MLGKNKIMLRKNKIMLKKGQWNLVPRKLPKNILRKLNLIKRPTSNHSISFNVYSLGYFRYVNYLGFSNAAEEDCT
jgi:hypothetical protein